MNQNKIGNILIYIILIPVSIIAFLPFYIMFIMGTYFSEDLFKGLNLLPGNYILENLNTVLKSNFVLFYFNSTYISILSVLAAVMVSAMAGYALSKFKYRLRQPIFYFIIMTMMVPYHLGLIGFIIEMRNLGLNNSHIPLILVNSASAFGVFWMTQYISSSVPTEVIESARIDGCNEFSVFLKIVLPYIKPAIVSLSMLIFLWTWNSFLLPLIIINKPELYTIPLGITTLGDYYRTDYAARIMGLALGTLPLIGIFMIGSKYLISGLTAGAVKG